MEVCRQRGQVDTGSVAVTTLALTRSMATT
jgi:hypothetical protein